MTRSKKRLTQEAIKKVVGGDQSLSVIESVLMYSELVTINTVDEAVEILRNQESSPEEYNAARNFLIAINGEAEGDIIELLDQLEISVDEVEIDSILEKIKALSPFEDLVDDYEF